MIQTLALLLAFACTGSDYNDIYKQVKTKHDECWKDMTLDMKTWKPFIVDTLKNDFSKFTGDQLLSLYELNVFMDLPGTEEDDPLRAQFMKMVRARPDTDLADVVLKLLLVSEARNKDDLPEIARIWNVLTEPAKIKELMAGDKAGSFLSALVYYVPGSVYKENPKGIENLYASLPEKWPTDMANYCESLWTGPFSEANIGKDRHEKARVAAVDAMQRALKVEKGERTKSYLEGVIGRMTGAAATGKLVGYPVQGLNVIWSSDPKIASMDSLKGRVVVLDFWATWCGPCIASMPKLKETVTKYAKYPVTVVGVTSIQGNVIGLEDQPINVENDPKREMELMTKYMAKKAITWPVIFTQENVFNPHFGVRGIPYTAIIDPAGKVRYTKLHPGVDHEKIEKYIDELLKEFRLDGPGGKR